MGPALFPQPHASLLMAVRKRQRGCKRELSKGGFRGQKTKKVDDSGTLCIGHSAFCCVQIGAADFLETPMQRQLDPIPDLLNKFITQVEGLTDPSNSRKDRHTPRSRTLPHSPSLSLTLPHSPSLSLTLTLTHFH